MINIAVVHGGPGDCGSLAVMARELSKSIGTAELIQSKYSIPELIGELHTQLNEITADPITLLGHSWGAWLVVLYAAKYPKLVDRLILVGSGPFKPEYVPFIAKRRFNNLSESETGTFKSLLAQLEDPLADDKDSLLTALGSLVEKADNYNVMENYEGESSLNGEMYSAIWPQADAMRRNGELAKALGKLKCPVTVVHGEYDPHPVEGVAEPLKELGIDTEVHVLPKCGHSPFKEKFAADEFYRIVLAACADSSNIQSRPKNSC